MQRYKIEIPVIIITLAIMALIALSGNLVYKNISEILDSWNNELKPDRKIILVNDLIDNLDNIETSVKLYSLSKKHIYFSNYYEKKFEIKQKLDRLQTYWIPDSVEREAVDSLLILSERKICLWEEILDLYLAKVDGHSTFAEYHQKIGTIIIETDTINLQNNNNSKKAPIIIDNIANDTAIANATKADTTQAVKDTVIEKSKKKGFFKRLFGKKDKETTQAEVLRQDSVTPQKKIQQTVIVVDRSSEKAALQKEMKKLEKEIASENKIISEKAALLMQQNLAIKKTIERIKAKLEAREKQNEQKKSKAANWLANQTYKRLINFAATVFLLLILVLLIIFRYLKKSRQYQKALKKAKENAEQLAMAKKMFTATVSHEMRTPVNVIYGLSEQLLQQNFDDSNKKDIEVIYKSARQLNNLVSNTFDLTRIENKHFRTEPINFRLDNLLERIKLYYNQSALDKGINLSVDKGNIADTVVYDDEKRLEQILNNLIANAIKFTDNGSVILKAHINNITEENKKWLIFEVSDTGIGISEENKDKIFIDFVQLETDHNKQTGGTGLGLYISKKLTELLGGEISVDSKEGKGSTFSVKIPYRKGDAGKIKYAIKSCTAPNALKNGKVLIVDDDEFNRHLLKNILTKWEINFDEAENGKRAVELTDSQTYSLIMMDIRMPVMSGTKAVGIMRAMGVETKIIALSANSNITENAELFDAFLEKPFNEAGLHTAITQTLPNEPPHAAQPVKLDTTLRPTVKDLMLMANDDKIFLKEMIEIFIKTSKNNLVLMEQSIQGKNNRAIADIAHKMASSVKQMDITEVYKTIKDIEKMADTSKNFSGIEKKLGRLKKQLETVNKHLRILVDNDFAE